MCAYPIISFDSFRTKAALVSFLESTSATFIVLGDDAKVHNEFFCLTVHSEDSRVYIGIISLGNGPRPSWLLVDQNLLVGYNDHVAVWEMASGKVRGVVDLLSLFYEFIEIPSVANIFVLCESAIVAISTGGDVQWRRDTDVICSHEIENEDIVLHLMDEGALRFSLTCHPTGEDT